MERHEANPASRAEDFKLRHYRTCIPGPEETLTEADSMTARLAANAASSARRTATEKSDRPIVDHNLAVRARARIRVIHDPPPHVRSGQGQARDAA